MKPDKRFGSDQRIRRQTTFRNLVEKGQFARGEFFYLWVGRRDDGGKTTVKKRPMLGVAVNRKAAPTAVGRNLWKRRVREIFREYQKKLRPEAVCLVKVRNTQKKPIFPAVEEDLVRLFKKAGAWT